MNLNNHIKNILIALPVPIILFVIWEVLSQNGYVNVSILPPPSMLFETLIEMIKSTELLKHAFVSIIRVLEGFSIGSILAITLGILLGFNKKLERSLRLIIGFLRPIPTLAWIPLLILWLGIDEASKVTLIAIGTFWTVFVSVAQGIKYVDKQLLEVAYILEKNRWTLLTKVILPSALPSIFSGLRAGIDMAWRSVVGAELIAASAGLGFLISYARDVSQTNVIFVGIFAIGFIGIVIEGLIKQIEKRLLRWNVQNHNEL